MLEGEVHVGDRLGLDSLRCVDDQQGSFTGGKRAADLVGKVDVPRGVDQVQFVFLSVGGGVRHPDGMRLDRDAAFLLQVHGVQKLCVDQIARFDRVSGLEKPVRQSGLSVVDMGNDGKIANSSQFSHIGVSVSVLLSAR